MKKCHDFFFLSFTFGSHLITFNEAGNVLIHDRIMDKKSNIVDLLRASVSVPEDVKPPGYTAFIQALPQINVPSYFLSADFKMSTHQRVKKVA